MLLALGGLWLDRTLGSTPWITIVAALLGLYGAGAKIYYQYRATMAELDETRAQIRSERILAGEGR
ncbi:MAG: AtpZ/AtpI family protein [Actinomycetia bacterium]|nr:AtpZ/AtpI family protein [Actinomycetes bacterium]